MLTIRLKEKYTKRQKSKKFSEKNESKLLTWNSGTATPKYHKLLCYLHQSSYLPLLLSVPETTLSPAVSANPVDKVNSTRLVR